MALVELTLYSAADGTPLTGNAAKMSFRSLQRINADDSVTDLTSQAPSWVEKAPGMYRAEIDDALVLGGSEIRYIVDTGLDAQTPPQPLASSRFYDGSIDEVSPKVFSTLQLAGSALEVFLRQGDRAPSLVVPLVDGNGVPVNLTTGSPSVVFNMRSDQGGNLAASGACSIVDAANGLVLFPWPDSSAWLGNYFWEMVLTQGGLQSTYPYSRKGIARVLPHV